MSVKLRERSLANGRKRYYLDIHHEGQRYYEWLFTVEKKDNKTEKRQLAQNIRSQREIEINSKGTNYRPNSKKKIPLQTYLNNYIATYQKRDFRTIESTIKKFVAFIDNPKQKLSTLTDKQLKGYQHHLKNEAGLKGETPYSYWCRLKKVLKQAANEGYLSKDVFNLPWKNKKGNESLTKQILTEDEIAILKETYCGNDEVKRAFLFACYTGLGLAEIRTLTWSNVKNGRLKVYRAKTETEINLKLSASALELAGEPSKGNIFNIDITDSAIVKNLKGWLKKAKIDKHITFYCGRHTFAVRLLNKGANLKTVADAMGHKTTAQTVKYLAYTDKQKDNLTSLLD